MKQYTTIALLLLSVLLWSCGGEADKKAAAEAAEAAKPQEPAIPDLPKRSLKLEEIGLQNPESVTSDGQFYYVSNLGPELKPFRKDQNGFIMKLDSDGKVVKKKFISGLDAPKGMVIVGTTLYVTDIDKVKAYDLDKGKRIGTLDISKDYEDPFLNDIVVKNNTELYASLTNISKVISITLGEKMTYKELAPRVPSPNGLAYDAGSNTLYTNSYDQYGGFMGMITWGEDGTATYAAGADTGFKGQLDGMALIRGKAVYSDWTTGALRIWNPFAEKGGYVPMQAAMRGPADFYFDEGRNELWIPAMQENRIYVMFADF
ncbi:MAG: YncE family protein [Bacteroidia bacterium]